MLPATWFSFSLSKFDVAVGWSWGLVQLLPVQVCRGRSPVLVCGCIRAPGRSSPFVGELQIFTAAPARDTGGRRLRNTPPEHSLECWKTFQNSGKRSPCVGELQIRGTRQARDTRGRLPRNRAHHHAAALPRCQTNAKSSKTIRFHAIQATVLSSFQILKIRRAAGLRGLARRGVETYRRSARSARSFAGAREARSPSPGARSAPPSPGVPWSSQRCARGGQSQARNEETGCLETPEDFNGFSGDNRVILLYPTLASPNGIFDGQLPEPR